MSSISSFTSNYQHKTAIDALKNLLLYESDDDKTNLLALLYRLNIKNDSISSHTNLIDQPSFYLSHSNLRQSCKSRNNSSRRRKSNKNDNVHYRNMITVRRISCHDITKRFEYQSSKFDIVGSRKTRSVNLKKCDTCSMGFQSSSKLSTLNEELVYPSTIKSHTGILFSQRDIEKKMSNSVDRAGSKVISTHDSSTSSLVSTQLRTTGYDQIKPDVTIETSLTHGSQNDFQFSTGHSPHRSTSSIVPHVPHYISSPTTFTSSTPNDNIQDLIDQLKTCIDMLSVLLQNKSSPLSDHPKLTKTSNPNRDNLIFEDITVKQCNSPINQIRRRYPNHLPNLHNDRPNELKRCLLVYCRNRNKNSHLPLSRSSSSLANTDQDILSISKSTSILSEQDSL